MTFVQNMVLDDRTCDAGSNILDGLITMSQESYLCPTLQVLCYSGHFRGKSNLMSKVNDIIGSVESLDLVCECYDILSGLTAGSSLEYVQVIAALMKSVPFGQYITKVNPSNKEKNQGNEYDFTINFSHNWLVSATIYALRQYDIWTIITHRVVEWDNSKGIHIVSRMVGMYPSSPN